MEKEEIELFLVKNISELENSFGLNQYFETKTNYSLQNYLIKIIPLLKDPVVIRSNDGVIEDILKLDMLTLRKALIDDENHKGLFFTRNFETVFYLFDGKTLCLNMSCLILTVKETATKKIEQILIKDSTEYFREDII